MWPRNQTLEVEMARTNAIESRPSTITVYGRASVAIALAAVGVCLETNSSGVSYQTMSAM